MPATFTVVVAHWIIIGGGGIMQWKWSFVSVSAGFVKSSWTNIDDIFGVGCI